MTHHEHNEKNMKTIRDYVKDMASLESHIEEALDRQMSEVKDHPQASQAVQRFHDMVKHNRDHMKSYMDEIGATAGNPITEAGSAILGKAAGIINLFRTEGVSKALRDDYTAFNLAAMGYSMLYTTATALGSTKTAQIAEEHLRNYARAIQEINDLVPQVVVWELEKDQHEASTSAVEEARAVIDRAWRETSPSGTGTGTTGMSSTGTTTQMPS